VKNRRERWPERRVLRRKREFDDPRFRCPALGSMNARTSTIHSELASVASSLLKGVAAHLLPYRKPANPRGMLRSRRPGETGNLRTPRHRFGTGCLQGTACGHQESVNGTEIGVCSKERDNENPRR
jgi:hypothetical protein